MDNSSIWSIYNIQLPPVREAGEKIENKQKKLKWHILFDLPEIKKGWLQEVDKYM